MRLYLRIRSGIQIGDAVTLNPPGGLIGRSDGSSLCVRDASVSRAHLELRCDGGSWWAIQHSTRSASIVDGQPVGEQPQLLGREGTIQVGNIAVEYHEEESAPEAAPGEPSLSQSPQTVINIRPQLSAIQHAVKTQLHPLRPPEPVPAPNPPAAAAPATLILRRADPPLRNSPPPIPAAALQPRPTIASLDREAVLRTEVARWQSEAQALRQKAVQLEQALAEEQHRREELSREHDFLQAEVARLRTELAAIQSRCAPAEHRAIAAALPQQALLLLHPFSDSLEQACAALSDGDSARARTLIRDASFGLADLRDLLETAA